MEDTFESMEDGEDMEEAAEEEVDKILFDITAGMCGNPLNNKQAAANQESLVIIVLSTMHQVVMYDVNMLICNTSSYVISMIIVVTLFYIENQTIVNCCVCAPLGALGKAPSKVTDALPEMEAQGATAASEDESEEDIEEMQSRLAALRS